MTFDPTSVEGTCVTLAKDHCVQVPWEYINVCGYSDRFCKNYHIHTYTFYIHILHTHTTYRISDHIVSFWTTFRRDKKRGNIIKGKIPRKSWILSILVMLSFEVRKLFAILSWKCLLFGSNRTFLSKVMIDHREIDTSQISRKSNFPIEMYTISFLCILLLFTLRYLRNEQNNFKKWY